MQGHACQNPHQNFAADVRILLSIWARVFKCSALFSRVRWALETAPHLLSLAKDVKLVRYTVPTGKRTPGHRVAVHYTTAAPRKLQSIN